MNVNSKMTAIADKTRELVGVTGKMGLDDMASNLGTAANEVDTQNGLIQQIKAGLTEAEENMGRTNNEISTQSAIIQQIKTALEDKTAGGGVQLPTLTNPGTADDLVEGKQLIDANGDVITGVLSKGFAVKTGTTNSGTIDTGLSKIDHFYIYRATVYSLGLIHLHYRRSSTSRLYASVWSANTKTITTGTGGVSVSGGTVTISATQAAEGGLAGNVNYTWVAIGTE